MLNNMCQDVEAELARRTKNAEDREHRWRQQRADQEELDREEKWKQLHMSIASSRFALRFRSDLIVN